MRYINKKKGNEADQVNSSGNNESDMNTIIIINTEKLKQDEDGQHMLIEQNSLTKNKNTYYSKDENNPVSIIPWKDLCPQVVASCVSLLMVIQPGINLAYSNNLLYYLPSLNKEQFSWITSILALCIPLGAVFIGLIMDSIGRKKACLLTCLPLLASWITASFTSNNNIYMFYASRIFAGIGAGMTTVGLIYVSEISHSSYKQILLSLNSVFFSGGIVISTSLADLNWKVINLVFIILTTINIILIMVFMPESPIWILKFNNSEHNDKAKAAVKKFYPKNDQLYIAEWNRLNALSDHTDQVDACSKRTFVQTLRSSPAAYKPMAILVGLLLLQQLSGAYPIISYALPILNKIMADGHSMSKIESLRVLGIIRFITSLFTCPLSFYVGRKPLLISSCIGMTLSSALVACTFDPTVLQPLIAGYDGGTKLPLNSLALCGVMLFVFSSSLGVLVFPWTMVCELLSTPVRAVGGCLLVSYTYVLMFAILKVFPYVLTALPVPNIFLAFGTVSTIMAVYVYFVVPETLGKTFEEIEYYFDGVPKPNKM